MRNIRGISLFWILFLDGGETAPYLASAAEQVKGESFSGIGVWALNSKPISAAPRSPVCLNIITIKGFYQESPHTECSMTWKTFAAQDLKKRVSSDDDFILNPGRSRGVSESIWPVWTGLCRAYLLQQGQRAHPLEAHFSWIGTCQPGWRCFPVPFPGDSLRPGLSLAVSTEGCSHARASAAAQAARFTPHCESRKVWSVLSLLGDCPTLDSEAALISPSWRKWRNLFFLYK